MEKVIQSCREMAYQVYSKFDASHDMQHIDRVLSNAKKISATEPQADEFIIELGVLLHDIDDPKYLSEENPTAKDILEAHELDAAVISDILTCIAAVSFSGGNEEEIPSIEGAIMRDADRLDAIGAIGIARAFAFGGAKGRKLYDLSEVPRDEMTEKEYRKKEVATVTHFYEKLLKIKGLMVTAEGIRLAQERHDFMESFLRQLYHEVD
ncbi:HD domain-containing protein [Sporosarcina pasteurii]|uniref:Putative hydrolase n=1 Tax=Sporosarcina pasteurii TaxID=1474 RepID=A0A380BMF9_SPOPA|nr:HD domain-containing protein [Sporosarcina pasteurii]MDS9470973.1 HD domain-containing protein [Sporosarcina pasteurii]QBQ05375.1 HD domain-containing protein [Sporosarcina pasteurii]SUJ03555.1 putative hydrolase [Sporosarcina pasteurii]